jgi:hypothetical protein
MRLALPISAALSTKTWQTPSTTHANNGTSGIRRRGRNLERGEKRSYIRSSTK